jgi:ABC-type antimicrobial peptide transport system permease subunit
MTVLGLGVGVVGALALSRLLAGMLFETNPADPATYVAVALILGASALLACAIPARRATQVQPAAALRAE